MTSGASTKSITCCPGDSTTGSIPDTVVPGESSICRLAEDLGKSEHVVQRRCNSDQRTLQDQKVD